MPRIDCNYSEMTGAANNLANIAKRIDGLYEEMKNISYQIPLDTYAYRAIRRSLGSKGLPPINKTGRNLRKLSSALNEILTQYKNCENNVQNKQYSFTDLIGLASASLPRAMADGELSGYISKLINELTTLFFVEDIAKSLGIIPYDSSFIRILSNYIIPGSGIALLSGLIYPQFADMYNTINYVKGESKLSIVDGKIVVKDWDDKVDNLNDSLKEKNLRYTEHYNSDDKEGDSDKIKDSHKFAEKDMGIAAWQGDLSGSYYHLDGSFDNGIVSGKGSVDVSKYSVSAETGFGKYTYKDKDGNIRTGVGVYAETGASYSLLEAEGEVRLGDKNTFGMYAKGDVAVGKAEIQGGVYATITESGPQVYVGGNAELVAAEVSGSVGVSVLGTDVGVKGSVKVGVGVEGNIGIKDGHIVCEVGASLGLGFSLGIDIDASGVIDAAKEFGDNVEKAKDTFNKAADKAKEFFGRWF